MRPGVSPPWRMSSNPAIPVSHGRRPATSVLFAMILRVVQPRQGLRQAQDNLSPFRIIKCVTNPRNDHYWAGGALIRVAAGAVVGLGTVDGSRDCCDLRIRSWIAIATSLGVCHLPPAQIAVTSLI